MVELKARFDEEANIHWAKSLEEAGVHVVYGIPGLKTHVKAILVARREGDRVREYVHIGTGNYNPTTARLYTDFGLFTADPEIGADVAEMFNFLTGYGRPAEYRKVLVSPTTMRDRIVEEIEETVAAHAAGEGGADRAEDELAGRRPLHPGPLRGLAGRGPGRPQRARDLLPAPGGAGGLREHPRRLDRRPLPRALAGLRLPARRGDPGPDRLRRPDAAQPRQPRRAGRAGRGRRSCGPSCSTCSSAASPTTSIPGSSAPTAPGRRLEPGPEEPRNVQEELRERHAARAPPSTSRPPPADADGARRDH